MGIRKIEINREFEREGEKEFIFEQSTMSIILNWEDIYFDEEREEYKTFIKKYPIPKDKYFNFEEVKKDFDSSSYIDIICEKEETADWFSGLLYELI